MLHHFNHAYFNLDPIKLSINDLLFLSNSCSYVHDSLQWVCLNKKHTVSPLFASIFDHRTTWNFHSFRNVHEWKLLLPMSIYYDFYDCTRIEFQNLLSFSDSKYTK